jgi:hypothetical protein
MGLRQHSLHRARGQTIACVVDITYHDRNIEKVIALARDADQLAGYRRRQGFLR